MSCGVGHKHSSDPKLLWLWLRPTAIALIGPLAWEPPYTTGAALKRQKKKSMINTYIVFLRPKAGESLESLEKALSFSLEIF